MEGNLGSHPQSAKAEETSKSVMNDDDGERVPNNGSDSEDSSDEDENENEPLSPKRSTGVTKASATAPFDITNILNDEDECNRPSASFRDDDWGESVTLPPLLLWEDMATRPMFDLE